MLPAGPSAVLRALPPAAAAASAAAAAAMQCTALLPPDGWLAHAAAGLAVGPIAGWPPPAAAAAAAAMQCTELSLPVVLHAAPLERSCP